MKKVVDIRRKKGETFESLLRRFSKVLLKSGKILQVKKKRFFTKEQSRNLKRNSALVRLQMRAKREYLKKIGRLEEPEIRKRW